MNAAWQQLRNLLATMSLRQLAALLGGLAAVGLSVVLLARLVAKPEYEVLYANLAPADAQDLARALSGVAIPFAVSPDGTGISVPSPQLDQARVAAASRGLPRSGQWGFELFDKPDWTGSDFADQINYQRALEGELERTIETIHGVQSARVHITMPHESLYASQEEKAKAAVVLTLDVAQLPSETVGAVQHLVSSAVENLSAQDVAVLDADGTTPLDTSSPQMEQARQETLLRDKLLATLAPVVGADHVQANVNLSFDPTQSDDTQEIFDPTHSVLVHSQSESAGPGGATAPAAGGTPGTASNLPGAKPAGTNLASELGLAGPRGQTDSDQTFAVSRSVNHVTRAAGAIQRMTAAVVVDDVQIPGKDGAPPTHRKRSDEELQQLQALAAATIGIDTSRGDVLTVSDLSFSKPADTVPVATWWRGRLLRLAPQLVHYGGLFVLFLMVYLTLLRPLGKIVRRPVAAAAGAQAALPGAGTTAALPSAASELASPAAVQNVLLLRQQLMDQVRRDPILASRLIAGWVANSGSEE